jgi:2-Cys peroxiredoxin 5
VPSYRELQNTLKEKAGIDEIIIYCVNDGAVMQAWADDQMIDENGIIKFMGDPEGALTRSLDMELIHPGPYSVGIIGRCKRFALYAVNGEVKYVAVSERDDDPAGDDYPEATLAESMLFAIMKHKNDEL